MTSIKNHLGLILPLFAILFAIEYLRVFDRVVESYESRLQAQYTVIVVADKNVTASELRNASVLVASARKVDPSHILNRLRQQISRGELQTIKKVLPAFYLLKLRHYPDKKRLEKLKKELMALRGVKKVQVFEKEHDRLYEMLLFMKSNFYIFAALIALIGFLLVMKQMMIWQLEHSERMRIMALFGAPVWLRSGVLFRLALVDASVALISVVGAVYLFLSDSKVRGMLDEMAIDSSVLLQIDDLAWLASAGFGIAFFCALWVVLRFKEEF